MASGSQGKAPQNFSDALGAIIVDVAQAKLTPDADMKFLNTIEMVLMGRLKHPDQQGPGGAQPTGAAGAPGGEPPGGPGGPPAGGPPPGPGGPPPGPPPGPGTQSAPGFPTPDPEDMRRTIAQTTGS